VSASSKFESANSKFAGANSVLVRRYSTERFCRVTAIYHHFITIFHTLLTSNFTWRNLNQTVNLAGQCIKSVARGDSECIMELGAIIGNAR